MITIIRKRRFTSIQQQAYCAQHGHSPVLTRGLQHYHCARCQAPVEPPGEPLVAGENLTRDRFDKLPSTARAQIDEKTIFKEVA
jgi:hypothetical protein